MSDIVIRIPPWLQEFEREAREGDFSRAESRMELAISLSRRNVEEGTGGPFGAAVFERRGGALVAAGVNAVVPNGLAIAHAEVMALSRAQALLGCHDLFPHDLELVSSSQPCVLCFGAFWWSGPRSLVIGARARDVEEIAGFREGPLPEDWEARLEGRGISVRRDLMREEACAVLRRYAESGGAVYNSGG